MLTLSIALLVALQEAPVANEPAAPAAPAVPAAPVAPAAAISPELASVRFCTSVMMLAQGLAAEQAGPQSSNAMMAQSMVDLFQNERRRLGDSDDAAIEAQRADLMQRAIAAGGPAALTDERARFESECMPFIMNGRSG